MHQIKDFSYTCSMNAPLDMYTTSIESMGATKRSRNNPYPHHGEISFDKTLVAFPPSANVVQLATFWYILINNGNILHSCFRSVLTPYQMFILPAPLAHTQHL